VVLIGDGPVLTLAATLVGTLYAAFAGYALVLVRWRPQAPCGCSVEHRPASSWTVLRSVALSGLAFAALRLDQPIALEGAWHATITLMVGVGFALLLWHLPDALAESPLETP
ncbi:MAG TPA: MauE/DoxX family redox-associated membrane protein, partial [Euzebyales bacterium]|nr:MauE/DoxX family redox-associated membrane protein [Euzebyales bacterium]